MKLISLLAGLFLAATSFAQSPLPLLAIDADVGVATETPILDMDAMLVGLEVEAAAPAVEAEPAPYVWWYCLYWDGTYVYNRFRDYRTYTDVSNYFRGYPGSHDCDAYYYVGTTRYRWCTRSAQSFAYYHRGIRRIARY